MSPLDVGAKLFEGATDDPYRIALRAYVWGFAPILATKLRQGFTNPADPFVPRSPAMAGAALNNLGHQRRLSDATLKIGVAPNVDTLYSLAWLDLADEPFVFEPPDFGSRYNTFQMGYGDSACDVSLGSRTHGRQLPPVYIAGPAHAGPTPEGMLRVSCPTRFLLLAGRILVQPDDPADYEVVYGLQRGLLLRPLSRHRAGDIGPNPVPAQRLLDTGGERVASEFTALNQLGNVLREWVVRPHERALIDSFRRIGVTPEGGFNPDGLSQSAMRDIARGLVDGAHLVEEKTHHLGTNVNGWTINTRGPEFGDDYLLRAAVAKDQIYVVPSKEALYPVVKVDGQGERLTGAHAYRLVFAPGQLPPVGAFWSLTMYTRDGPLVANPINRYAIGDRTPGLVHRDDGGLEIHIQHAQPGTSHGLNWLPAPEGEFHMMLRLYIPDASVLSGAWAPPSVGRTGAVSLANS